MTRQYDRGDVPRSGDAATRAGSPTPGGPQGGPQSTGRGQKCRRQSLQWRWLSTPAERDAGRSSLPGAGAEWGRGGEEEGAVAAGEHAGPRPARASSRPKLDSPPSDPRPRPCAACFGPPVTRNLCYELALNPKTEDS